ncbi:nitrile hydratase subunit beta [Rhizobium bangladeshense]|uniref:SH3-like domain-containing protein n=1 Tax=Rhizobium bangladeshense TaxID=1138189 RepID=UPI001C82A2A8|nr:SH3-like domain-containing protein [Rhizobium bangladeshense]MBX4871023.1 nitrile hydratase subunit beta [Rhizobium bangladeshense]MBX4871323.1 nitrile hydratase subunit beta [Rhizobium bangladeshense]MBX4887587.1 nitrile hydratase subunit beta [Rhizobium bangladeshense]
MHSIADMGGMRGFGPVIRKENEPLFNAKWEETTFAVNMLSLAAGCFNLDESRHSMERMEPLEYLKTSYYEHWLHSLEDLLISKGIFTREEYNARIAELAEKKE